MVEKTDRDREAERRKRQRMGIARSVAFLVALVVLAVWMQQRPRPPEVLSVTPATALDDEFRPVEPTEVFGPEDTFFVSVELRNYQPGTLGARWLYEGQVITEMMLDTTDTGDGYAGFVLRNDDPPWPTGQYTIEITYRGRVLESASFRVEP